MAVVYDSAVNIIGDCAVELGLVSFANKPTDVYGSSNPNIGQLCQLLKSVGRNLMREHQWTNLQSIWLFDTSTNVGRYALPGDLDRVIDQTAWNRTNRLPLGGPISPQTYEFLQARLVGVSWNILWRILQGKFQAYPSDTTPGSYTIAFEYISRWWVIPSATQLATAGPWLPNVSYSSATPDYVTSGGNIYKCTTSGKSGTTAAVSGTGGSISDGTCVWQYISAAGEDAPTQNSDVIQFDPQLVRAALKLAFLLEKKMPADSAKADYDSSLAKAISADIVAPVLYFNRPMYTEPLLGPWNLPTNGTAS